MEFKHIPVMLNEVIDGLNIKKDGIYIDGTIGGAGHSKEIIKRLSDKGLLIGIDRDKDALKAANENLKDFKNYKLIHGNHDDIRAILNQMGIDKVDGILMRMDKSQKLTAMDVVNKYSEKDLADIIYKYGEEKHSRTIAKNICIARKNKKITTTKELVDIIEKCIPFSKDGHPAKRTFQAIRIEVNNEINPLYNTILNSIDCLKNGGRICVITFHSLEDRAVKNAFKEAEGKCTCPSDLPYCICDSKTLGKIINKKPIIASEEEQENNSRSKSAKLRIFERREKNSSEIK